MAGSYATAALDVSAAVGPFIAATALGGEAVNLGPLQASGILVAASLLSAVPSRVVLTPGRSSEVLR